MDISTIIKNLHPLEIKVLLNYSSSDKLTSEKLQKDLGYKEGHANQAFSWLGGKELVKVEERIPHTFYEITECGENLSKNGLIEERVVDFLKKNGAKALPEIASDLGIENKDIGSAFGQLSKEGVLKMNEAKQAEYTGKELPARISVASSLLKKAEAVESKQLDSSTLSKDEIAVMATLAKKRGAADSPFKIVERETVIYSLCGNYKEVVDALKK